MKLLPQASGLRRDERGVAAVEFGLLLPVLMLLLLGAIDFGRFSYYSIAARNAARAGAAWCNYDPDVCSSADDEATIRKVTQDEAAPFLNPSSMTVTITRNSAAVCLPTPLSSGVARSVAVRVRYEFRTLVPWPGIPQSFPIIVQACMRPTVTIN